ncbi:hypothetical protein ACFS5L_12295 [Streptomyces phyllanthi]|uniref:Extensin n=1 Tax=Streptomyces phyllanthi TaxID=1803180 RepID=A0A5N8WD68_9ACTN|nr:hypothetical protein [Streptomyces phyllanthi]MPY45269.1 hypothetical protein [Streptomyces phyllanthi]
MADEQYKWLDRDAAERLLRGESLEAVDADTRAAAHRLTEALDALTALTVPNSEIPSADAELPGEEAALAAFRKARSERDAEETAALGRARTHATPHSADAGLVRLGRPGPEERRARWGRPLRLGMAAALAAGMLGGVAVAAGAGILPTPLRDDRPEPGSSAAVTPDRSLTTPSPEATAGGSAGEPSSGGAGDEHEDDGAPDDTAQGGGTTEQQGSQGFGKDRWGTGDNRRGGLLAACRDVRAGKDLNLDRRRGLEDAAGGKDKVRKYCEGVLGGQDDRTATGTSDDGRGDGRARSGRGEDGQGSGNGNGNGNGNGKSGRGDKGGRDGGGDGEGPGILPGGNDHHGSGFLTTPFSTFHVSTPSGSKPSVAPSPTYSALESPPAG